MFKMLLTGIVCLAAAFGQDVQFDYNRSANFGAYRTYQWNEQSSGKAPNQLMDQNIRRAIDAQMVLKGFQLVDSGADVQVNYQAAVDQEKRFDAFGTGPRFYGTGSVTTSTVEIGKLAVEIYDPATRQIVWRCAAAKTLDIKKDPEKNFQNLQKTVAKMFKTYPSGIAAK